MNYLIEEQSQLKEIEPLFETLSLNGGCVAVDTEFFREKTYSAKLCLVQLGIADDQYCIDVLAIKDLSALTRLFADEKVLKLLHAARQDMEVIVQTLEVMPKPIFDTQVAAAFAGQDMQIGYSALVQDRLGIELPKSQARTDWTRRPLSAVQVQYAGDDVAHLAILYQELLQHLEEQSKTEWYQQEIESYYDIEKYNMDPAQAYRRLSGGGLKTAQQYTLKALAEWREETAQRKDIPRTWVLRDDALFDLACRRPKSVEEVIEMNVFGRKSANRLAPMAVKLIEEVEVGEERLWNRVEPLTKPEKKFISELMKQVSAFAEQHQIAQALIATRRDIECLYRDGESTKLLAGWRAEIVGQPLLEYIQANRP